MVNALLHGEQLLELWEYKFRNAKAYSVLMLQFEINMNLISENITTGLERKEEHGFCN